MCETMAAEHGALLQFLHCAPVGLAQLRRDGEIVLANPLCAQWLKPLAEDSRPINLFDTLQACAPELRTRVSDFGCGIGTVCEGLQLILPDRPGRRRWGRVLNLTLISLDSERLMAVPQDITLTLRRERELRRSQMWMNTIAVGLSDHALVELDHQGRISSWNLGVHRALGFDRGTCIGRSMDLFYPRGGLAHERVLDRLREADHSGFSLDEGWRVRADGTRYWGRCLIAPLHAREPGEAEVPDEERRYSLIIRDTSEGARAGNARHPAMTGDDFTGPENRRSFFEAVDLEMVRWLRAQRPLSVLMVDSDHFKVINDSQGRVVGDAVLRHLAACLSASLRGMDVVARLGGAAFAVLLPGASVDDAALVATRLCATWRAQPAQVDGVAIACTVSIGVAAMHSSVGSAEALLQRAELAMQAAKAAGRDRIECWRPEFIRKPAREPGLVEGCA